MKITCGWKFKKHKLVQIKISSGLFYDWCTECGAFGNPYFYVPDWSEKKGETWQKSERIFKCQEKDN